MDEAHKEEAGRDPASRLLKLRRRLGRLNRTGTVQMSSSEKHPEPASTGVIYVNGSLPASLVCSEKSVSCGTLEQAIIAWLALPNDHKRDASIKVEEKDGALYRGWEIYRLWRCPPGDDRLPRTADQANSVQQAFISHS